MSSRREIATTAARGRDGCERTAEALDVHLRMLLCLCYDMPLHLSGAWGGACERL